jgi:hypothetical protein
VLQITSFLTTVRGLEFSLFDGSTGALLQSQWGALSLCALLGAGLLSSRLPLIGGAGLPTHGQERCGSPAGRCSVKCWASVYLGETGLLVLPAE